jgi:choline kinase
MHNSGKVLTGVILAAGMGKRLRPLTDTLPKALVKVNGRPLFGYTYDFLRLLGCSRIGAVGGFGFTQLTAYAKELDQEIIMIENPRYEMQNALSLEAALTNLDGDLLVTDVDYIRPAMVARRFVPGGNEIGLFMSLGRHDEEDLMRLKLDKHGRIEDLAKGLIDYDAISAGALFVPDGKRAGLLRACHATIVELSPEKARLEDVLRHVIHEGIRVKGLDVGPADWQEIDTLKELEAAEEDVQKNPKKYGY